MQHIFKITDQNSIGNQYLAELRNVDVQKDRMRFRHNLERIGSILAYEISKTLDYAPVDVETPLGIAATHLPGGRIVLATVLRAGLPFHQGMLNMFDQADNAFIAAYRKQHKDGSFDIQLDYVSTPSLEGVTLILCDPMLATGKSMNLALDALLRFGKPAHIHIATIIASTEGIDAVRRRHPKARIWAAAVDEELTAKSYIVPGLGDAGDLAYGDKH